MFAAARRAVRPLHRALPLRSSAALFSSSSQRFSASRLAFEGIWQRRATSVALAQLVPPFNRPYLAAMPMAAALTIFAAQQVPKAECAADMLPSTADAASMFATSTHEQEELTQQHCQSSAAAASPAMERCLQHDHLEAIRGSAFCDILSGKGLEQEEKIFQLLNAYCVGEECDSLSEVFSTMASLGVKLDVRTARTVAQSCEAQSSATLEKLMIALQDAASLTAQCCALAIAAALELQDVDTALRWFDTMKRHGIERDEQIYAAIAEACYIHRYHDCMHVLKEAKLAGLMPELAEDDSSAMQLLRAVEHDAQMTFRVVQAALRLWVIEGSATIDLTRQGRVPQELAACSGGDGYAGVVVAVAGLRLLLQEVVQHKAGDTWFIARAALLASNYLIFDGPTTDTLHIKFRTGSLCGNELARELRAQLQSGAISVSDNADDGTTTYTMHVPGVRVYCADSRRKMTLQRITQLCSRRNSNSAVESAQ
jgi:hypothetical protein